MSTVPQNSQTITVYLTPEQKQILEKAATITGLELNNYIMHHALSAALVHLASYNKIVRSQSPKPAEESSQEPPPDPEEKTTANAESKASEAPEDKATHSNQERHPEPVKFPDIDDSKALNDLAKAMMVSLAWSYADAWQKNESLEAEDSSS